MQKIKISDLNGSIAPLLSCFTLQSMIHTKGLTKTFSISKYDYNSFAVSIYVANPDAIEADRIYFEDCMPINCVIHLMERCGFDPSAPLELVPKNMGQYNSEVQTLIKHIGCHLMFSHKNPSKLSMTIQSFDTFNLVSKYLGIEMERVEDKTLDCYTVTIKNSEPETLILIKHFQHHSTTATNGEQQTV